jgi:CBS domain-containing protein
MRSVRRRRFRATASHDAAIAAVVPNPECPSEPFRCVVSGYARSHWAGDNHRTGLEEMTMQQVQEIMTTNPVVCSSGATLSEAATIMRDRDIGDVLIEEEGRLRGIVTDRDIVVRAVAEGKDVSQVHLGDILSDDLVAVSATSSVDDALELMRSHALRRMPVVDGDRVVGIVSLGDLAVERDPNSALSDISAASPNN